MDDQVSSVSLVVVIMTPTTPYGDLTVGTI